MALLFVWDTSVSFIYNIYLLDVDIVHTIQIHVARRITALTPNVRPRYSSPNMVRIFNLDASNG